MIARREGDKVRIWSRNGIPWGGRLPGIVAAVRALPARCVILDRLKLNIAMEKPRMRAMIIWTLYGHRALPSHVQLAP
jgi:hypothetical protein